MTPQETILQSGLALRDILARNPTASSVTLDRPDGEWTYRRDVGLELCAGGRTLSVPDAVFDAAEAEAWELVGS